MKRIIFILSFLLVNNSYSVDINNYIKDFFTQNNIIDGTVVIYNLKDNKYTIYNKKRAEKRFYPASTFKIFNSLIALEYNVIKDVDEIFYYYDNSNVFLDSWKKDSNLRYAIKVSQVPAYKLLARKIGLENMKNGLDKLNYGNKKIGNKLDSFWLNGPLKISAIEQVKLITLLSKKQLPFSIKNQEQVIDIILLENNKNYSIYGKTGSILDSKIPFVWFVGWIKTKDNTYSFAINFNTTNNEIYNNRLYIIKSIIDNIY